MQNVNIQSKQKLFGLVRDSEGNPKISGDPKNLHPSIKALLTQQEKINLGID